MENLNSKMIQKTERPIKVIQFGEGNFLRAFVDYMIDIANEKGAFDGDIAIVKEYIVEAFATGEEKYEYTAYVYEHPEWIAMDGNYNAENVYFDSDIIVTTKVGTIDTLVNG